MYAKLEVLDTDPFIRDLIIHISMSFSNWPIFIYIYLFISVHPPEAPIEDRVVRNISSAIPLTAEDDYPFNLTINWDPPAYHYKKVVLYLVTLFMYKNNSCSGEISLDYIRSGLQVSWLYHQSRFWCLFFVVVCFVIFFCFRN